MFRGRRDSRRTNLQRNRPQPQVRRSQDLIAIYLPPFCDALDGFEDAGPAVLVAEDDIPLVRVTQSCDLGFQHGDRLVLVANAPVMRREIRERAALDPHLFRMAQSIRCGFRRGLPPPAAYLDSLAGPVAEHLQRHYAQPLRERESRGLSEARLVRALAFIDERLPRVVPIEELAEAAFLSPFHFGRMFKRSTGLSPHEFVTHRRIGAAAQLLASTPLPIVEIARRVGYENQAHFSTAFRRVARMTPSRYRLLAERGEAPPLQAEP